MKAYWLKEVRPPTSDPTRTHCMTPTNLLEMWRRLVDMLVECVEIVLAVFCIQREKRHHLNLAYNFSKEPDHGCDCYV